MHDPFAPRVGGVLSADIAVPDHARVVRFYTRVLCTGQPPLWRDDLMNDLGMPIIGLGPRTGDLDHLPLQWMPHIQVADVAASAARAVELGGGELMHARDADGGSQWAVLADGNGAAFGIIPVVSETTLPAAAMRDAAARAGRIRWIDVTVPDAAATCEFYRQVVGWSNQAAEALHQGERNADHVLVDGDGRPAAGIHQARGENRGVPPASILHLPVRDLDASLQRVQAEGGAIIQETRDQERGRTHAVVEDPVGACFALVSA